MLREERRSAAQTVGEGADRQRVESRVVVFQDGSIIARDKEGRSRDSGGRDQRRRAVRTGKRATVRASYPQGAPLCAAFHGLGRVCIQAGERGVETRRQADLIAPA